MGRLLCAGAITALFVALAAIAITAMVARTGGDSAHMPAEHRPNLLRLQADSTMNPPAVGPGGRFHYRFWITNAGDSALRNVAVRSETAPAARPAGELRVLSVSDRMCAVNGQVNCLFPELLPGASRSVRVEVLAPRPQVPADRPDLGELVVIRTFAGSFVPGPAGGVDFSVIGDAEETVGRLTATTSRQNQAGGRDQDQTGAGHQDQTVVGRRDPAGGGFDGGHKARPGRR